MRRTAPSPSHVSAHSVLTTRLCEGFDYSSYSTDEDRDTEVKELVKDHELEVAELDCEPRAMFVTAKLHCHSE